MLFSVFFLDSITHSYAYFTPYKRKCIRIYLQTLLPVTTKSILKRHFVYVKSTQGKIKKKLAILFFVKIKYDGFMKSVTL